jgi:hypothetical protein
MEAEGALEEAKAELVALFAAATEAVREAEARSEAPAGTHDGGSAGPTRRQLAALLARMQADE